MQVRKYLREEHPAISHYLDLWHVVKGLKKALKNAISNRDCHGSLAEWSPAIQNHMYWCAASTEMGPDCADMMEAKWLSLLNHICGKHVHNSTHYPKCSHGKRTRDQKKKKYMKKGTPDYELLCEIVMDKRRMKDVRQLSPLGQTSCLEAHHSTVNHFAPKMIYFHHRAMETRLLLAAIHTNYNADNSKQQNKLTIFYPKSKKGEATVRRLTAESSYGYIDDLLKEAFRMEVVDLEPIPEPMATMYNKPGNPDKLKRDYTSMRRFVNL